MSSSERNPATAAPPEIAESAVSIDGGAMTKKQKPQLHYDILMIVAEKLMFSPDNEFNLDLREVNAAPLKFMFVNRACREMLFAQFRKLTKLSVTGGLELHCQNTDQINQPKQDNFECYQGPFNVNDWFFYKLLCRQVLRLRTIETFYAFGDSSANGESAAAAWSLDSLGSASSENLKATIGPPIASSSGIRIERRNGLIAGESPAESLIKLFLFKDSPESLEKISKSTLAHCILDLDTIRLQDDEHLYTHFDRILNLNAKELHITLYTDLAKCVRMITMPTMTATRTEQIAFVYTIDVNDVSRETTEFPFAEFRKLLVYIAQCCPSLKHFVARFVVRGEFTDEDFTLLSNWLLHTVNRLVSDTLHSIHYDYHITVAFRVTFPEAILQEANEKHHELMVMGEPKTMESEDCCTDLLEEESNDPEMFIIARLLKVEDSPLKKVTYSLVGIEDDDTRDDWQGFAGPAPGGGGNRNRVNDRRFPGWALFDADPEPTEN